jgi:hypothetical protein
MNEYNLEVDLEIDKHIIKQVINDFGSQVNILPQDTWNQLGRPLLAPIVNLLQIADQRFIESIGTLKNVTTYSMSIPIMVDVGQTILNIILEKNLSIKKGHRRKKWRRRRKLCKRKEAR